MSMFYGAKILIVEDEPLIALSLEDYLKDNGALEVQIATTYAAAQALISLPWADFAIVDIILVDGSGYDLADSLTNQNVPFIFSTGCLEAEIPERHRHRRVCSKPVNYCDLASAIKEELGGIGRVAHMLEI